MAKQTLADTVDESEIIDLGEEVSPPNILIDDDFGIDGEYGGYSLQERKIAYRTGTVEDGVNEGKVIKFNKWSTVTPHSYGRTIFDVLRNYREYYNLSKIKGLKKCKDFAQIEAIYQHSTDTINRYLATHEQMTKQQTSSAELIDTINRLKEQIKSANKVFDDVQELHELVKEKRRIVINDTEPKKHRVKLEE